MKNKKGQNFGMITGLVFGIIAAIILILGILAVLVTVWQRMRMGQNSL